MTRPPEVTWIAALAAAIALATGCASTPPKRAPGDIAAAYLAAGRNDEAAREIELAVRTRPRDPALRRQAARIHASAGNTERAIGHLEMATQLAPQDESIWIELGKLESDRDNVADAYVAYRRASRIEPDDLRAVSGLAVAAEKLGFRNEAEAAYDWWAKLQERLGAQREPAE